MNILMIEIQRRRIREKACTISYAVDYIFVPVAKKKER